MRSQRMVLMTACDEAYFPLAKGLFLSLIDSNKLGSNLELAFLDIGCSASSIQWLQDRAISIVPNPSSIMGDAFGKGLGYHRAQTCRPYLPELFPSADVLAWVDCDTWFQDVSILAVLEKEARTFPNTILVSPEIHYTYTKINDHVRETHAELYRYYQALYGADHAYDLHVMPSVNSGFFAMHAECELWAAWKMQIQEIYLRDFHKHDSTILHFGEQASLNMLIRSGFQARYFDPLYNYLCLWCPPYRDDVDVVRSAYPPYPPIGMAHLAGGWRHFGRTYAERMLLYKSGDYLSETDKVALLKAFGAAAFQ